MSQTYTNFPEMKSERTTEQKLCRHYGRAVVLEFQKILFQLLITFNVTFNDFFPAY